MGDNGTPQLSDAEAICAAIWTLTEHVERAADALTKIANPVRTVRSEPIDIYAVAREWLENEDPGPRDPEFRVTSLAKWIRGTVQDAPPSKEAPSPPQAEHCHNEGAGCPSRWASVDCKCDCDGCRAMGIAGL